MQITSTVKSSTSGVVIEGNSGQTKIISEKLEFAISLCSADHPPFAVTGALPKQPSSSLSYFMTLTLSWIYSAPPFITFITLGRSSAYASCHQKTFSPQPADFVSISAFCTHHRYRSHFQSVFSERGTEKFEL